MTRYLLDTNILSDMIKRPFGAYARMAAQNASDVRTSLIVAAELRFGAVRKQSAALVQRVEDILAVVPALPFEAPADELYARLRDDLERQGRRIGDVDMLIAAHALALDATLVTANTREFERVEGLRVENWLA